MKAITLLSLALTSALSLASLRADEAASFQVKVPEMTCSNCAWSVTEELKKVEHVTEVFVDPKTKVAIFSFDTAEAANEKAVLAAVKQAGYQGSGYAKLKTTFAEAKAALSKS
jgi:copper chaperone CopZ